MCQNHGVAYISPGEVEVREIAYPTLSIGDRKCNHGVILKIVATNICGSDQHMVRGRTTAPSGMVLGHEITGVVIEAGTDVEFIKMLNGWVIAVVACFIQPKASVIFKVYVPGHKLEIVPVFCPTRTPGDQV